jgi:xylan 1,4-beta-xylosidase
MKTAYSLLVVCLILFCCGFAKGAQMIENPILRGFNPDPSIVRVNDDYYVATSTFEWFPGVAIHHSKDLVNWELACYALNSTKYIDLRGNPTSGGVWAPCLTYSDGLFYLVYSDVKNFAGPYKDQNNYLITAKDINGPWSDPIFLNSSGFDASMFHDDDGKKWLLNMLWDFRYGRPKFFAGIVIQQYDPNTKTLVGPVTNIFKGSNIGTTEGPHIYKRNGYYYLITAEGGTGQGHAVTLARSKNLLGPYEIQPDNPVLTARNTPDSPLTRAGHASLVETQNGEFYIVHLCSRPIKKDGKDRCVMGRETAIQKVKWSDDGWLHLENNTNLPQVNVPGPNLPLHPFTPEPARDNFDNKVLNKHFSTLRVPPDESWLSLTQRPGWLRIYGRESLGSKHRQSMVARRITSLNSTAETYVEFEPKTFQQAAGLICIYDTQNYYYIKVTNYENVGKCITVCTSINNEFEELTSQVFPLTAKGCFLKAEIEYDKLYLSYSLDGKQWNRINETFDISTLSDEGCQEGSFTGAFVGICAQDLAGTKLAADFDYFEYQAK